MYHSSMAPAGTGALRPGLNRAEDRQLLLRAYFAPAPVPAAVSVVHAALRRRILAWNRLKRVLRPWRR